MVLLELIIVLSLVDDLKILQNSAKSTPSASWCIVDIMLNKALGFDKKCMTLLKLKPGS